jgi:hypothetical protein
MKRLTLTAAALAIVLTASAQADTSARHDQVTRPVTEALSPTVATAARAPRPRRCLESYTHAHKLRATRSISCRIARIALTRWFDNDDCDLDDSCAIRIGRDGALWKCSAYRAYATLNPY